MRTESLVCFIYQLLGMLSFCNIPDDGDAANDLGTFVE